MPKAGSSINESHAK